MTQTQAQLINAMQVALEMLLDGVAQEDQIIPLQPVSQFAETASFLDLNSVMTETQIILKDANLTVLDQLPDGVVQEVHQLPLQLALSYVETLSEILEKLVTMQMEMETAH